MRQFIDDYLDLLPLFAWIDIDHVMRLMEGEKATARPTYHYRLPNSRVDEVEWKTSEAWNRDVNKDGTPLPLRDITIEPETKLHIFVK